MKMGRCAKSPVTLYKWTKWWAKRRKRKFWRSCGGDTKRLGRSI